MSNISADLIKELRAVTGVGMSKCKEALVASSGSLQEAINYLRKKGMASAAKKEGRETKEGTIVFLQNDSNFVLIEVNAETDFVVQNAKFQEFAQDLAKQALDTNASSLDALLTQKYAKDDTLTIDQYRNLVIQSLGENIQIKRLERVEKKANTSLGVYSHMQGKILAIVEIQGSVSQQNTAKEVAMHVAACNPDFLQQADVPEDVSKREEEIARAQIKGKPEHIIEKILSGKMQAFYDACCLVTQPFVKDPSFTIEQFVTNQGKSENASLVVSRFWRWKVGQ